MSEIDNKLTDGFAERLCDLMQENKTCADALAQELNLSSSAIYKWLRKASLPEFENAIALADFFDCSLDYLFALDEIDAQYTPHHPSLPFCEQFSNVLTEKKMSEYRLVKLTGISRSKIASWRKGKSLPGIHSLITVADVLDLTLDGLVGRY